MKTCPVCNEAFVDEMNFCDVDGSPLNQDPVIAAQSRNKLWSMLGIVLLVGALVMSLMVVFLPRQRPAPALTQAQPEPPVVASAPKTSSEPATVKPPAAEPEEVTPAQAPVSEIRIRERSGDSGRSPGNATTPNPKAAATDPDDPDSRPARKPDAAEQPVTTRVEPVKAPKTPAATGDGEPVRSVRSSEPKKDVQPSASKTNEKDSKKKGADEKEKKKGGFFRVFKKIFGKD